MASLSTPPDAQPSPVAETARLVFRRLEEGDAPFILELLTDPDWLRYIGDKGVRDLDGARRYIADGPGAMYAKHGFGLFLVGRKPSGAPMGLCGLIRRDGLDDVDVGYAFLPRFRGCGYAEEAAAEMVRFARERVGLPRIVAITTPENERSIRVLEKLGFAFERVIRLTPESREVKLFGRAL
jgi:RimJ/RimL family protein N-acetyltransferase